MLPIFAEIRHLLVIHLWCQPTGVRDNRHASRTWSWYHYAARCYQLLLAAHNDNGHVYVYRQFNTPIRSRYKDPIKAYQIDFTISLHYRSLGLIPYSTVEQQQQDYPTRTRTNLGLIDNYISSTGRLPPELISQGLGLSHGSILKSQIQKDYTITQCISLTLISHWDNTRDNNISPNTEDCDLLYWDYREMINPNLPWSITRFPLLPGLPRITCTDRSRLSQTTTYGRTEIT